MEGYRKALQGYYACRDIIKETCDQPYQAMFIIHQLIEYVGDRMGITFKKVVEEMVKVERSLIDR